MRHQEENRRDAIFEGLSNEEIRDKLIDLKESGVRSEDVLSFLESMRSLAPDEACEDRILDIMDMVVGWCSADEAVWDQ